MSKLSKGIKELESKFSILSEANYLKVILNSYFVYNHRARLDIATILYKNFNELKPSPNNNNLKSNIFAEIYTKLMQSLEDFALLAIMFLPNKKSPLEIFTGNENCDFNKFFFKAKKGLSDREILKIYGLDTIPNLLKKKMISESEVNDFQKEFNLLINGDISNGKGEKERWKGLGRVYIEGQLTTNSGKKYIKKSGAVSVYHNIKHSYKVLVPDDLFKQMWKYDENYPSVNIIEKYDIFSKLKPRLNKYYQKYANHKTIKIGSFGVNEKTIKEIYERIYPQSQNLKVIAYLQLTNLTDPSSAVKMFRYIIYKNKFGTPKSFEPCPCKSGKKYKKCHMNTENLLNGLEFKE